MAACASPATSKGALRAQHLRFAWVADVAAPRDRRAIAVLFVMLFWLAVSLWMGRPAGP